MLGGRSYTRPAAFALAAAESANWQEAKDLVLRGAVTTWLEEIGSDTRLVSEVRRLASDANLDEDFRHALALMALNSALPLTMQGEIVTPAWLLSHPVEGYSIVAGDIVRHLERIGREEWLVRLGSRAEAVRERAKLARNRVGRGAPQGRSACKLSSQSSGRARSDQAGFP